MKKLLWLVCSAILCLFSFTSLSTSAATPSGLVPPDATSTITIEKSASVKSQTYNSSFTQGESVTLKFPENLKYGQLTMYYLKYKMNSIGVPLQMNIKSEFKLATNELTLHNVDWSKPGPYYGVVVLKNYVIRFEVLPSDKGTTIIVPFEQDDFVEVDLKFPNGSGVMQVQGAIFEDDGNYDYGTLGHFSLAGTNKFYVPKGFYGLHMRATNTEGFYQAYAKKQAYDQPSVKFEYTEVDFSKLTINPFEQSRGTVKNYSVCDDTVIQSCWTNSESIANKDLYYTKQVYAQAEFGISINERIYTFLNKNLNLQTDQTVEFDSNLTTTLKFNNEVFVGGSTLYLKETLKDTVLKVTNQFGQKLTRIVDVVDGNYKDQVGKLVFRNGSEQYEVELKGNLNNPYIQLPNVSGTFDVTYTFGETVQTPTKVRPDVSGTWKDWPNTKGAVASNYTWTINLSSAANAAAVTNNNIFVVDAEGYLVEGVKVKAAGKQILVLGPTSGYEAGKSYTLYIRDTVKNAEGEALVKAKMSFGVK